MIRWPIEAVYRSIPESGLKTIRAGFYIFNGVKTFYCISQGDIATNRLWCLFCILESSSCAFGVSMGHELMAVIYAFEYGYVNLLHELFIVQVNRMGLSKPHRVKRLQPLRKRSHWCCYSWNYRLYKKIIDAFVCICKKRQYGCTRNNVAENCELKIRVHSLMQLSVLPFCFCF